MQRIITGATGLIGKQLTERWLKQGHSIIAVGRTEERIRQVFGSRVQAVTWDNLHADILESAEVVVNLAGANLGDEPWSEERKQEILISRTEMTAKLADLLTSLGAKAPALFNASAIGIYGLQEQLPDRLPQPLDETLSIDWKNPGNFLSLVACRWEQAAASVVQQGSRVVFMRFAVVLAKEGGALKELIKPFKFYAGGTLGTGHQPFSWVAMEDVLRAIDFLLAHKEATGAFNIVSPGCVSEKTFVETLAKVLNRPAWFRMPGFALKYLFGSSMARELLLEGENVYPRRLLELGFNFAYPDIESALNHILK